MKTQYVIPNNCSWNQRTVLLYESSRKNFLNALKQSQNKDEIDNDLEDTLNTRKLDELEGDPLQDMNEFYSGLDDEKLEKMKNNKFFMTPANIDRFSKKLDNINIKPIEEYNEALELFKKAISKWLEANGDTPTEDKINFHLNEIIDSPLMKMNKEIETFLDRPYSSENPEKNPDSWTDEDLDAYEHSPEGYYDSSDLSNLHNQLKGKKRFKVDYNNL